MNSPGGTHPPATAGRKTRRPPRCGGLPLRPSTPLLHWTFYNNDNKHHHQYHSSSGTGHVKLSARKLAAGLWQLRLQRCGYGYGGFDSKRRASNRSRNGNGMARAKMMFSQKQTSKKDGLESDTKHQKWRSQSNVLGSVQGNLNKVESLFPAHSGSVMEGATKWESKTSTEAYCFISQMKLVEDHVKTMSLVSELQAELMQAQVQNRVLESEVRSSNKTVKYLLGKLEVEKMSQKKKKHDNIYALIDDLKFQLSREIKRRQKVEIINSQLVEELAEAKLSAMQFSRKYDEEKRTRELMEVVCDELAKKIGEDKVEVEALRAETMKIRQELEQEREMLQMAEVWREERVQMKLVDAKLALESKYSQMNQLITALETFLISRSTSLDVAELRTAEMIAQAVKSVSIQDMEQFSYEPLQSGDIISNFEELREIEPCFNNSSPGGVSVCHPVSPEENVHEVLHEPTDYVSFVDYSNGMEEDNRIQRRVLSVDKTHSNRKSVKGRVRHQNSMEHQGSRDLVNPHIARGMKGIIERPKDFHKNTLKAKIFEEEIESKKAQLHRDSVD